MQDMDDAVSPDSPVTGETTQQRGLLADPPMRGLVYHAVLYLGVVLVLLAVNLRLMPDTLWVQWVALLWGLLLAGNAWAVLSARRRAA